MSVDENQNVKRRKTTPEKNLSQQEPNMLSDAADPPFADSQRSKVVDSLIKSGAFSRPDAEAILASRAVAAAFSSPACIAVLTSADAIAALSSPCAAAVVLSPVDEFWLSGLAAVEFFSSSSQLEGVMHPRFAEAVTSPEVVKDVSRSDLIAALSSFATIGFLSALAILTQHPLFVTPRLVVSPPTTQVEGNTEEEAGEAETTVQTKKVEKHRQITVTLALFLVRDSNVVRVSSDPSGAMNIRLNCKNHANPDSSNDIQSR